MLLSNLLYRFIINSLSQLQSTGPCIKKDRPSGKIAEIPYFPATVLADLVFNS
jgi:hypothetical protein